ncbi:MAG TPA: PspC domain-containing protein, partial [Saprospiraceae bacterium]|nr:PspC domain-containing protein [Saprospiraceae bacterium]
GYTKSPSGLGTAKKLFRNPDDKKVAGICSGIAAYFGIEDPIWIRLVFVLLIFTVGAGAFTYIILWVLVPEAKTASDKLSMRGEPTTVSNIASLVEAELTDLGNKINKWSKDFTNKN